MSDFTNFIPEVWTKKLMKLFRKNIVVAKLCNTDYEGEIKGAGDTVHVRSIGEITIRNYTREQALTFDNLVSPMSDLLIDQQKYFAFRVDDIDKAQSDIKILEQYTQQASFNMRLVVDQNLHANAYANVDSGNVLSSSSSPFTLTKDNIYSKVVELGQLLDDDNAPSEGRNLLVDPRFKALLLLCPEFTRATGLGDKVVVNGEIGEIAGFRVHVSTNLNSVNGNRPILAMTKDLLSYADQVVKVEKERRDFTDIVKGLQVWGSKVFTNSQATNSTDPSKQGAVLWVSGTA